MKRLVFFLLIIMTGHTGFSQIRTLALDLWKSHAIPDHPDSLIQYNRRKPWFIILKGNQLYASREKQNNPYESSLPASLDSQIIIPPFLKKIGTPHTLKLNDGYLVAFNAGEFGSSLDYISNDGLLKYPIKHFQIQQFIKTKDKIYAIEGIAHMGINEGGLIEFTQATINYDQRWIVSSVVKFKDAPRSIGVTANGDLIVLTFSSLVKVRADHSVETLIEKGFWPYYIFPASSSFIIKDQIAYIGMTGGVFKFNLQTKKQDWLMPY